MSGTQVGTGAADRGSHSLVDDPLFYIDDAGETAFGRLVAYTCYPITETTLATHKLALALVYMGRK